MYNLMTCSGPDWSMTILGGCSMAWLVLAILFFIILILRRQCSDGFFAGIGFSFIGALVLGLGASILLTTLTGDARFSLLAGIIGLAAGGFGLGLIMNTSEGYE